MSDYEAMVVGTIEGHEIKLLLFEIEIMKYDYIKGCKPKSRENVHTGYQFQILVGIDDFCIVKRFREIPYR